MAATQNNYRVVGINDDESTCSHCGRTNLKRVVWLATLDTDGNTVTTSFYGVDCAARLMGMPAGMAKVIHEAAKAIAYADRWLNEYPREFKHLDAIRAAIGVKFNTNAWVDGDKLIIATPTGMIAR